MPRAAIYARFSTDLQNDRSVDDQIALCREFAEREGHAVVEAYSDKARSGTSIIGRDDLLRLMDDARAHRFDVVIVEALDRLSRDQEDLPHLYKRLSHFGIEILAVHDGRADAIQIGIRGLVSTLFIADLKHKIRRGMQGVIRDGRHAGGRAYGYRPTAGEPGRLQIEEAEAAIVRRIFDLLASGRLPREIAAQLNNEGVPPPRGAVWGASTIVGNAARGSGILHNQLYAGKIVWNRLTMVRDPDTGRRISRANDPADVREAAAPHLAIIDRELFDRASQVVDARAKLARGGSYVKRPKRILSGILKCECGSGMSIKHRERSGAIYVSCTRALESGTCGNRKKYRLDKIEAAVIEGLKTTLSHPAVVAEYVRVYREERRADTLRATRDRAATERRISDIKGQLERLMQALSRGVLPIDAVEKQYAPLDKERQKLESELASADDATIVELHPRAIAVYQRTMENLSTRLQNLNDVTDAVLIETFRKLVSHVVIYDHYGRVECETVGYLASLLGKEVLSASYLAPGGTVGSGGASHAIPPTLVIGRFAA